VRVVGPWGLIFAFERGIFNDFCNVNFTFFFERECDKLFWTFSDSKNRHGAGSKSSGGSQGGSEGSGKKVAELLSNYIATPSQRLFVDDLIDIVVTL